ncbi:MAG TPA: translation initiation factor IF-3 [candidate division WOR-3 bacterium]|uniref:Translation initiation factor IF-3 n=1 Tax=candidate division WOR-3 bacterium TaxID=2052148 RepID=A0A7V0XF40_UNCW3|nr:translation initiation factor IF-3 [candidate division WOR-3 bacterium]
MGRPRVNGQIRVPYVRVIGPDRKPIGILPTREALSLAQRQGLDLVLVAPQGDPPVCGIMNFGKYLYEQKVKSRESKKKQHSAEVREMRMKMKIDKHDYDVKMRKMREFLTEKDRIRVTLMIRGREVTHTDLAFKLLERLSSDLADVARVDGRPRVQLEGRKSIQIMLVPK